MSVKRNQIMQYTQTWVTNRYVDFFRLMLLGFEPKEVNPTAIVNILLQNRYKITGIEYRRIKIAIHQKRASYKQKVLYFLLEDAKQEALRISKNLNNNIENIYRYHYEIGTPFNAILFHIYSFIKFGIKNKSSEHEFGELLNFLFTKNEELRNDLLNKDPQYYSTSYKSAKYNANKSKQNWLDRAVIYGHTIEKRKLNISKVTSKR